MYFPLDSPTVSACIMLLSSEIRICEVQTMLKIGEFSKLSRISIRMLRHYDEIGLLRPVTIDAFTGYRYYGEDQLPLAGRIAALRDMGFGLSAISEVGRKSSKCNRIRAENLSRSFPIETFSGAVIDKVFDKLNILIGNRPEIKAFGKEKSDNVVRIFVCSALPWFMRLGKEDKSR